MTAFIGSDHRGFQLKHRIIAYLNAQNINVVDVGCNGQDDKDDYNDFAHRAVQAYLRENDPKNIGILICGTGHGMCMQANRFKGIRAVRCLDAQDAQVARTHNDANFICLGADEPEVQKDYQDILDAFLRTQALSDEKYLRRNHKLDIDLSPTVKSRLPQVEILPTLLTNDPQTFRDLTERYHIFTDKIHFDFIDGSLPGTTPHLSLKSLATLNNFTYDIHLMTNHPEDYFDDIISLRPNLAIFHVTNDTPISEDARIKLQNLITMVKANRRIKVGLAVEPATNIHVIKDIIKSLDHVMLFSGHLGHYGGEADLNLLEKIPVLKNINPFLTIGWDGGVNASNISTIAQRGVNTINVGSAISRAPDSAHSYHELNQLIRGN